MAMDQIDYEDGEVPLTGFLVRPEGKPKAAVLVLPTIVNCNTPMIRRAHLLAQAGYVAMIADFYGVQVRDFDHARELAGPLCNSLSRQPVGLPQLHDLQVRKAR